MEKEKQYLLAESGSTKTDWFLYDRDGIIKKITTKGINPGLQSPETIFSGVLQPLVAELGNSAYTSLEYYGAGTSNNEKRSIFRELLSEVFGSNDISVNTDMLASARATSGDAEGIVCILGTGSNSCHYDGQSIVRSIGGQGYLFGDEGSGADLGKHLLIRALNRTFSDKTIQLIIDQYQKDLLQLRNSIYSSADPNVKLAEFALFISRNIENEEFKNLVEDRFSAFLKETVFRYDLEHWPEIHFTGSVAAGFNEVLEKTCNSLSLKKGKIIKEPGNALLEYHLSSLRKNQ